MPQSKPILKSIGRIFSQLVGKDTVGREKNRLPRPRVKPTLDTLESRLVPTAIVRTSAPTFFNDLNPSSGTALTCNYASYQVTNDDAIDYGDLWVKVDNFTAGSGSVAVQSAPNAPTLYHLGPLAKGETKPAFFYLSSNADSITATQAHTITVFNGIPSGSNLLAAKNFSFTSTLTDQSVENTIQAEANKVISVSVSTSSPVLGSTFSITVVGETGTIGDGKIVSFNPAAYTSWRADAFQLTTTKIQFTGGNTGTFNNTLAIPSSSILAKENTNYTATYTFKVVGSTTGAVPISPIAFVSSGQNIKHTKLESLSFVNTTTSGLSLTDAVDKSSMTTSGDVSYTLFLKNADSKNSSSVDQFVNTLPAGAVYVSGSSAFNGLAISDPVISGSVATGQKLTWSKTFAVGTNSSSALTFKATIPAISGSYVNSAVALLGSTQIDSTISTTDNAPATVTTVVNTNAPPAITSGTNATFTAGSFGSFTVIATGNPAPSLTETGALPSGVTFDGLSGRLSGTPAPGTGGTYLLSFRAKNGVGPDVFQSFSLTINQEPIVTSVDHTTFSVGSPGNFIVTASGSPAPHLSAIGILPSGLSFNENTGSLSGTPAPGSGGTYSILFTAKNGVGHDYTQSFTLTVNQASTISSANNTTFTIGKSGSFHVNAIGYPAAVLSVVGSLPGGITFNPATGMLTGTPLPGTGGVYNLQFQAKNGVNPESVQTFTLNVNAPPNITSPNQTTFSYGAPGTFQVVSNANPTQTFSIISGKLPIGVTLDARTGLLSGTPGAGTIGKFSFKILASNSLGSSTQNFQLTVTKGNLVITVNNLSKTYGKSLALVGTEFSVSGLSSKDKVTSVILSSFGTQATTIVGTYPIIATKAAGVGLSNYNITYVKGNLTVGKADLTITPKDLSKTYGATATLVNNQFLTKGLVNSDKVNTVTLASLGTPAATAAGTYSITASGALGSGLANYNITYSNGTLTVNKANLTITANSRTKTQGAMIHFLGNEYSATGLVNGDKITGVNLTSKGGSTEATEGSYEILVANASVTGLTNYNLNLVSGKLTVLAREDLANTLGFGTFTADSTGKVQIDFLYDGGGYVGEMGIYSLDGMSAYKPGSAEFIKEATRRVLTNSGEGYRVISDFTDGAKNSQKLSFDSEFNKGTYRGVQTFQMDSNARFGFVLIPNGTFQEVYANPNLDGAKRALFSHAKANPTQAINGGAQLADITGNGTTFGWEDWRLDGGTAAGSTPSDRDYNDLVFRLVGAQAEAVSLKTVINPLRDITKDPNYRSIIG